MGKNLILFFWVISFAISANAASYSLPADFGSSVFSSCSGSGTIYSCNDNIELDNDQVSLSSNVTLAVNGNLIIKDNVTIDQNGFELNLVIDGNVEIKGSSNTVDATVSASGNFIIEGSDNTFNGDVTADGNFEIKDAGITVNGNVAAGGNVDIVSGSIVNGICSPTHSRCTGISISGICSPYIGFATLNEFFKDRTNQRNDVDDFVEIKLLDTSIPIAVFTQWSVRVCEDNDAGNNNDSDGCSATISLADFTDTVIPWLVLKNGTIGKYFNFKTGFDAILLDSNNDVIDYLSVDGYTPQENPGCTGTSLPYDYQATAPGASDKFIFRTPDGTGDWDSAESASEDPTENDSNDGDVGAPNLTFSNVTINQGTTTATITINLDAASADPIIINFLSLDGSLIDGVDYTSVNASGTIAAGDTSLTFDIPVSATANPGYFNFLISINNASTGLAIITNHVGSVTVVAASLDHYSITHGGIGVTCEAESITVTAHDNSENPVAPGSSTTITLSTSIANDGWSLRSGNGVFNGTDQYTFDGTETSVQFWLRKTTATTFPHMDIDVTDGTVTDLDDAGTEDAVLEFRDTAFRFYAGGIYNSIGNQIAGKSSDIAPGNQVLTLRAVQTNTDTGACDSRFNGTTQTVQMAFECVNPTTCLTNNGVTITDTTLAVPTTISDNPLGSVSSFSDVDLSFDATTGLASWKMNYADVGQIALHINLTIPASGSDPADSFSATSNNFVVRPFAFDIDSGLQRADDWLDGLLNGLGSSGVDTSWADNAGDSVFVKAGDSFNVTVRSVVWEAADDTNNDGVADAGSNLTNNGLTSNFGNETVSELVDITHTKVLPGEAGTVEGVLSGGGNLSLSNGTITTALSWDEVGIIDLTASLDSGDYLVSGSNVVSTHQNFGRFYPDHFELSGVAPVLTNRSDESCMVPSTFTYMGENFQIAYEISAMNSAGNLTQNYTSTSGFAKLDNTQLDIAAVDLTIPTNFPVRLVVSAGVVDFVAGKTVNQIDKLSLDRLATGPDGPFELSIGIAPEDSDVVKLNSYDLDVDNDSFADHGLILTASIYYGRLSVANSFGSEFSPQTIAIRTDYYDSATSIFVANSNDFCTAYEAPLDINLTLATYTSPLVASDLALTGSSTLLNGVGSFSLHDDVNPAAGPGVTGDVTYELTVPAFLQFDWDGISGDENPSATATFGIYSGDSKQIFYRQVYQ